MEISPSPPLFRAWSGSCLVVGGRRAFLLAGFIPKRGAAVMAAAAPEEAQEAMPVKA
ncbi:MULTISPECIES: hypothetical protein [Streptomyces]|uniref:Uncharacterized protein n=1 Tax=Streptomyces galilaeus TaxID=33899 RepID=A0ABW9IS52_STRGJ